MAALATVTFPPGLDLDITRLGFDVKAEKPESVEPSGAQRYSDSSKGRTLSSNGDGSDHGWGGHHFVLGGAVNGGRFFGTAPQVSVDSDDQVGRGRLLPTTSVDEYSATLARWFGVSASELPGISPNIGRFASPDLGFMKAG